jgi:hypothetical protein
VFQNIDKPHKRRRGKVKVKVYVVKFSSVAINDATDAEYNEQLLQQRVPNITRHMDALAFGSRELCVTDTVSGSHVLRVSDAAQALELKLCNTLIDCMGNVQKGVLRPQGVSPYLLMEAVMKNVPAVPTGVMVPFPPSKDPAYRYLRVCSLQLCISNGALAHVVHVLYVNSSKHRVYNIILQ